MLTTLFLDSDREDHLLEEERERERKLQYTLLSFEFLHSDWEEEESE